MNKTNPLRYLLWSLVLVAGVLALSQTMSIIRAEQSGGSPESGSASRLQQLATELQSLDYGATTAGSWGNWGESWNQIASAAQTPFNDARARGLLNGGNADFPQAVGGVHDAAPLPDGSYSSTWTFCNSSNNYCDTGSSNAEKLDENTGLIWSERISSSATWFWANNCKYPNELPGDDGTCNTNGEVACLCVKLTGTGEGGNGAKTGCEALAGGGWRLPHQKEMMMAYIDGSAVGLSNAAANYWSSTTNSSITPNAWYTNLSSGNTPNTTKTTSYSVRCVR